jgi:hypothetical protein
LSSAAAWAAAQCKVVTSSNVGFVARRCVLVLNPRHQASPLVRGPFVA